MRRTHGRRGVGGPGGEPVFALSIAITAYGGPLLRADPGWKTLQMVQRYAHLSPDHKHQAIERLAIAAEVTMPVSLPASIGFRNP